MPSSYLSAALTHSPLVTKCLQRELWPSHLEVAVSMGRWAVVEDGVGFGFGFGFGFV